MKRILYWLLTVFLLSACALTGPDATPTLAPNLPASEADVPRVSPEEARAAVERGEALIVDVRGADYYAASHVAGALSVPLTRIEEDPANLSLDKTKWIITYCTWQNEHTSARAAFLLLHNGFAKVSALLGGFQAWQDAGFPVEP